MEQIFVKVMVKMTWKKIVRSDFLINYSNVDLIIYQHSCMYYY